MAEAFIVAALRTASGKRKGNLSGWHPVDLAGHLIDGLLDRTGIDPAAVEDVLMGCVSQVNVFGGAIALGHPLGASGTRLMTTLLNVLDLRRGRYGLQTMCESGGMANVTIVERL